MSFILTGSFVSTGASQFIELDTGFDQIETVNYTQQSSVANPGVVKKASWLAGMPVGSAFLVKNTAGAATDTSSVVTSGGFTPIDPSAPLLYPFLAVTGITKAAAAVVTVTGHGYATGDLVRLTSLVGMAQLSGYVFEITVLSANTFSIPVDSSAFATVATAGFAQKLSLINLFEPQNVSLVSVTKATQAVVSVSAPHMLTAGAKVSFRVPSAFGMIELDQLVGSVVSVQSDLQYTVSIDTSSFTTFAFPAAAAQPFTPAQALPIGELTTLLNREYNAGEIGVMLGSAVCGAASDLIFWSASKSVLATNQYGQQI